MTSCSAVFEAFDETLMFQEGDEPSTLTTLKTQFKHVFHNISEVFTFHPQPVDATHDPAVLHTISEVPLIACSHCPRRSDA